MEAKSITIRYRLPVDIGAPDCARKALRREKKGEDKLPPDVRLTHTKPQYSAFAARLGPGIQVILGWPDK
ncbi:hypothetical protein BOO23_07385 [Vibrio navarrensis]|nr:hypothetical protein [Vibrio navarrensis]